MSITTGNNHGDADFQKVESGYNKCRCSVSMEYGFQIEAVPVEQRRLHIYRSSWNKKI